MGRAPCCDKANVKKGPWSPEEDSKLKEFIEKHGTGGNWIALPQKAGLKRCGKSCRLRWLNYLRPNIKHGEFSDDEDRIICSLFASIGSRWSVIAARLPGRTDNDIKNYWNTKLKKKLMGLNIFPATQRKLPLYPINHLQTPQSPSSMSLFYNTTPTKSHHLAAGLHDQPFAMSSDVLSNTQTIHHPLLQTTQDQSSVMRSMQYHRQMKDTMLMFGAEGASCFSSDGSCSQISHEDEAVKLEDMGLQSYANIADGLEENQRMIMLDYGNIGGDHNLEAWTDQKLNGCFGNNSILDYNAHLGQVKQLISSSSNSYGSSSSFFNDENEKQNRAMYFY